MLKDIVIIALDEAARQEAFNIAKAFRLWVNCVNRERSVSPLRQALKELRDFMRTLWPTSHLINDARFFARLWRRMRRMRRQ